MAGASDLRYKVVEAYVPEHDGEIELDVGDCITNVKDLNNGWTLGRNTNKETVGIFPSGHIVPESLFWPSPPSNVGNFEDPLEVLENEAHGTDFRDSTPGPSNVESTGNGNLPLHRACRDRPAGNHPVESPQSQSPTGSHTYEQIKGRQRALPNDYEDQELLPYSDQDDYITGSLPNPKTGGHPHKPHMMVKPNPGKSLFNRQNSDTAVKMATSDSETGNSPIWRNKNRGYQSNSSSGSSTPAGPIKRGKRVSAPPGNLADIPSIPSQTVPEEGTLPGDASQSNPAYSHPQSTSTPPSPNQQPPQSLESPRVVENPMEVTPSMESTERQNIANENNQNDISPSSTPKDHGGEVKRRYYRDYRTLECPPVEAKTPPMKYKPILKQPTGGELGRGREIHYRQESDTRPNSARLVASFLTGVLIGLLLFIWTHKALGYQFLIAIIISASIGILLILLFAGSRLCRCVGALLLPSTCTTRGRIACLIFITAFLLDGPVTNVYKNMAEVSRSMGCSAEQSYNQSMLLLQPFDTMMNQLKGTVHRLKVAAHDVSTGLQPLSDGLDQVEMDLYNGKLELTGTARVCHKLIDQAFNDCSSGIIGAQNQCLGVIDALGSVYVHAKDVLDKINPERWAPKQHLIKRQVITANGNLEDIPENERDICEPLDTTFVCQTLNNSDHLCQPSGWAGEAIQDAINSTMKAMRKLDRTLKFSVDPEPYYSARVNATKFVFQLRRKIQGEYQRRTLYFDIVISILKKIIPIGLLLLVYVTYIHVKNYVSKDTYDNVYVTHQFKTLDQKRAEVAGESLLPLKKYERNYLIDTSNSDLSLPEDGLYRIGLCVLILHITITFVCYLFDYVLYWILALVRTHGDPPEADVTGHDSLQLVITGDGVITDLLSVFLKGFHPYHLFDSTLKTESCLPNPSPPSIIILLLIFLLYFLLFLTILLKAYILRLRNRITAYFYPEREKARIVHLYNVVLNHRYKMPKLLQQRAKISFREKQVRESVSVCHQMAAKLPPCRVFVYGQSKCLVCGCKEDPTFRDCQTERCQGMYCGECYDDIQRICPLCFQCADYSEEEDYEELEDDLTPYYRSSKIYV